MAIHNPARIPVVAELRRQELLAVARHERLCRGAKSDGRPTPLPHVIHRRPGTVRSLLSSIGMLRLPRGRGRVPSVGQP